MKNKIFPFLIFLTSFFSCNTEKKIAPPVYDDYSNGSGITSLKLDDQKIEDLSLLGKVWGFLKYYHPEVAKGTYKWDYELFQILPKIISSKNPNERNSILSSWIESLGPIKEDTGFKIDSAKVKCYPDLDWINETAKLGDTLSKKLCEIKNAQRTGENYYVKLRPAGNPQFTNEDSCNQMNNPDAGYRLLCLFRYWNCIEYFYPNKHLIGQDWNNILIEFIPKFVNDSNKLNYELTVSDMIASIHDTHSFMICIDSTWINDWGKYLSPVKVSFIENKVVVVDYYNKELGEKSGLVKGDIILKIQNQSVDDLLKQRLMHSGASNYTTSLRNIAFDLLSATDSFLNITYLHQNAIDSMYLKCYPANKVRSKLIYYPIQDTFFKCLSPYIGYFFPGSFKNNYVKTMMPRLLKTKGLIIDFRCYPSDNILTSFINYFLPDSIAFLKTSSANIKTPGLFSFSPPICIGFKNSDYYKGKVVVLINERTQSQAEEDVMALQTIPNVIVIGSTTAGADGNVSVINLIGGIKTKISGRGEYYPDGRETQRLGIIPDIEVHPTIEGIRNGRDELLENAIETLNRK